MLNIVQRVKFMTKHFRLCPSNQLLFSVQHNTLLTLGLSLFLSANHSTCPYTCNSQSLTSEKSQLLAQLQSLESEHNRSMEEHHRAQEQLAELSQQHQQLLQEVREEEERRKEVKKQDEIGRT